MICFFLIKPTSLSLWCCELQYKCHDNTSSSPWLYRRLLYDFIALLVMSFIMSLTVISSPHLSPNLCHYKETPGYWFQICEAKCNLYSIIYYPPTPHLIPSSPIFQPQASGSVRNQRVCLTSKFSAKDLEKRSYNAVHGETTAFLLKFFNMCSWSGFAGLWDVGRMGLSHNGLRPEQQWIQWILQSQNRPFQRHRRQNQLPQDFQTWRRSGRWASNKHARLCYFDIFKCKLISYKIEVIDKLSSCKLW